MFQHLTSRFSALASFSTAEPRQQKGVGPRPPLACGCFVSGLHRRTHNSEPRISQSNSCGASSRGLILSLAARERQLTSLYSASRGDERGLNNCRHEETSTGKRPHNGRRSRAHDGHLFHDLCYCLVAPSSLRVIPCGWRCDLRNGSNPRSCVRRRSAVVGARPQGTVISIRRL